jgi:hypothetical protein
LPDDEDLLYVKAVYYRKEGIRSEAKATIYKNTLLVEGFGDTQPREVNLIAVDRSRNESPAVTQTFTPLEPDIVHIGQTLELQAGYGGIRASWDNPNEREISVVVLQKDETNEYLPFEAFYSATKVGKGVRYGMDTIPGDYAVYARDVWDNRSEIKYYDELKPLFEDKFDRRLFVAVHLPGDGPDFPGGWPMEGLWNGYPGNEGYSSLAGTGTWPQSITIDLGVIGKISRIRLFQRGAPYIFDGGNIRNFELWGCSYPIDMKGDWGSWTKLMTGESIKPSGLPVGENTAGDIAVATEGEDFFNENLLPVRYIRLRVTRTWNSIDNFQCSEIEVYGDNRH